MGPVPSLWTLGSSLMARAPDFFLSAVFIGVVSDELSLLELLELLLESERSSLFMEQSEHGPTYLLLLVLLAVATCLFLDTCHRLILRLLLLNEVVPL